MKKLKDTSGCMSYYLYQDYTDENIFCFVQEWESRQILEKYLQSTDFGAFSNSIGDPLLLSYWKDPDFDSQQKAFYYVRVIEIPTPRWTTYDAKFFGVELPKDVPASIQDRAYTSPIWYTPGK